MNGTENLGRCKRCGRFLIAEEQEIHQCNFRDIPIRDCQELLLDHLTDSGTSREDDHVFLAWGLNGVLYRLLICKHNPPHSAKRKFTGCDTKQGLDSTSSEILYSGFFT